MSQKQFDYQMGLAQMHKEKALDAVDDNRFDDARVHLMIASTLLGGLEAKWNYDKETLLNTAQALV